MQNDTKSICAITAEEVTGLNQDESTNIEALHIYETTVVNMLAQEEFDQLDCLAGYLRSTKERFPGGMWKLHIFYAGLSEPVRGGQHATEQDWNTLLQRLHKWAWARPQSVSALVALASAYNGYAWYARGQGYSDTVSGSGWKLFEERSGESRRFLEKAAALPTKCPEWYLLMLELGRNDGWSVPEMLKLYDQATQFEPHYYYYPRIMAFYLLPKWAGEAGDSEKFTQEIADRVGGVEGDYLYFQVANLTICNCGDDPQLSWERIEKGFQASERIYGISMHNLNLIAYLAQSYGGGHPLVANQALARIGEQWDQETWGSKAYFDQAKKWAETYGPVEAQHRAMQSAADENVKTPEGAAYKQVFERQYRDLVQQCISSEGASTGKFQTFTNVGADGSIEDIKVYWNGPAAACVYQKLHAFQQQKTAAFPAPPHASYWVKLELDASDFSVPKASQKQLREP